MSTPGDSTAPLALTFILPTRNRRDYVGRAVDSCLRVERPGVRVELLVVDGNSTDGSFEELQQRYGADPRVRLIRQTGPPGFMPACFLAVPQVQTPFVTFMYDDDVLSPFWGDLPLEMRRRGSEFVLGFSTAGDIRGVVSFERVQQVLMVTPSSLLRAFSGCGRALSRHDLPYSPVCALTCTDLLRDWMAELERFTNGRAMRHYFMMERNAGPDLMIYFYSILRHRGEIPVFDGPVAQFSAHPDSITSGLEPTDLPIGYWLAFRWLCDRLRAEHRSSDAGWCSAYAVRQGLRLILKRVRRGRGRWLGTLLAEVLGLAFCTLASRGAGAFVRGSVVLLLPRSWRPQFGLVTRAEPLVC
jgi:glycosyltransferase involved in cell wall biosynthesis